MGQVIFVVARESIEALLVIGILWAWTNRSEETRRGKPWLVAGIFAGLGLAILLALTLVGVAHFLGETAFMWFEIGIITFAAALIVQMVIWMRQHGQTLKSDIEQGLQKNLAQTNWWGMFFLAMIAVGREGSESVMFLYGSFLSIKNSYDYFMFFLSAIIGLGLAMFLFYCLQLGRKFISWRLFFRVTEILLLFLGASLLLTAGEKLMNGPLSAYDLPAWMYSTMWDTGHILNDSSLLGNLIASLFAYRSRPIGFDLLLFFSYWAIVFTSLSYINHRRKIAV